MKKYYILLGIIVLILGAFCVVDNIRVRNMLDTNDSKSESKIDCIKEGSRKNIRGISISTQIDLFSRETDDDSYDSVLYTSSNNDLSVYISYVDGNKNAEDVSKGVARFELSSDKYSKGYWMYKDFDIGDKSAVVTIIGVNGMEKLGDYIYKSLKKDNIEQI